MDKWQFLHRLKRSNWHNGLTKVAALFLNQALYFYLRSVPAESFLLRIRHYAKLKTVMRQAGQRFNFRSSIGHLC